MATLTMYRGDTRILDALVTDADLVPIDISTADLRFTAKRKASDLDVDAVIVKTSADGIDLGVGTGECSITIDPVDTDALTKETTLLWDLQLTDGGGAVKTPVTGRLRIKVDISRTTP